MAATLKSCWLFWWCIFLIPVLSIGQKPGKQWLVVTNSSSFDRMGEVIAVKRSLLTNNIQKAIPQVRKDGKWLISQLVNTDHDNNWDELLIEVSLRANTADTLAVEWVQQDNAAVFKKLTSVRLSLRSDNTSPSPAIERETHVRGFTQNIAKPYYQMEGPGIENDKVAFRAFFDYRNGKDVYGKIVDTPILEKVGVGASWHEMQPWGMDIFHTGNSLGAGGLAVKENEKIYRLGDADTSVFQTLYEGPLQAAFQLKFRGWDVGTGKRNGSETLTLAKGNFYYKNDITVLLSKVQQLIAGIANFTEHQAVYKKHNTVFSSISTYSGQAEGTNTQLGLAILFPSAGFVKTKTTDTASVIPNTSYAVLQPAGDTTTIYFLACWEKTDPRFATQQGFNTYLQQVADKLANPIRIAILQRK